MCALDSQWGSVRDALGRSLFWGVLAADGSGLKQLETRKILAEAKTLCLNITLASSLEDTE